MTPNPYLHNAHLDGAPFYWECPGNAAVLLFHGLTATPLEIHSLGERLYAAGYTVDGPLLPGHGTQPDDLDRVRWQDWTALAQERYDRLAARYPYVLVGGESTGAVLALWLAIHNPEVAGILAFAPAMRLALPAQRLALLYFALPFRMRIPKQGLEQDRAWQGYKVHTPRGVIELVRLQRVVRAGLKKIRQPILVVQGRRDRTIHPGCAELVTRGVSSRYTEMHWMFDSAHCVLLDQEFEAVARLALDFTRQVLVG